MAVPATTSATVSLSPYNSRREKKPENFSINTVWSNFEIADMDFWRSEAYAAFFNYLDRSGGFYYEVQPFAITFAPLY